MLATYRTWRPATTSGSKSCRRSPTSRRRSRTPGNAGNARATRRAGNDYCYTAASRADRLTRRPTRHTASSRLEAALTTGCPDCSKRVRSKRPNDQDELDARAVRGPRRAGEPKSCWMQTAAPMRPASVAAARRACFEACCCCRCERFCPVHVFPPHVEGGGGRAEPVRSGFTSVCFLPPPSFGRKRARRKWGCLPLGARSVRLPASHQIRSLSPPYSHIYRWRREGLCKGKGCRVRPWGRVGPPNSCVGPVGRTWVGTDEPPKLAQRSASPSQPTYRPLRSADYEDAQ